MISSDEYLKSPPEIAKELMRFFSHDENLVILDIGACEALDAIKYSNMFPNARVLAFEPLPTNLAKIEANLKKYGKSDIVVINEALSDTQGTATLFVSSGHPDNLPETDDWDYGNKSSSLLAPHEIKQTHPWLKFNEEIEVHTNTLKNACQKHNINAIDLIHMDV
jgi:FkbM family methyltransferase